VEETAERAFDAGGGPRTVGKVSIRHSRVRLDDRHGTLSIRGGAGGSGLAGFHP
jgi:hypothetical protein